MTLKQILEVIRAYPISYLGRTGNHYSALAAFICGFVYGARWSSGNATQKVFPARFNEFVKTELNRRHGFERFKEDDHWMDVIWIDAGDEEPALSLFFELYDLFNQQYPDEFG